MQKIGNLKRCLAVAASWMLLLATGALHAAQAPRITLVFRYDDYGNASDADVDRRVIGAFRRHRLRCTFCVIPFRVDRKSAGRRKPVPLTETKVEILRAAVEEGTVECAIHGYYHISSAMKYTPGKGSEWAGAPYAEQLRKLSHAKQYMEEALGESIVTFAPPWNSYDANTVRALADSGFTCLTASRRAMAAESKTVRFLPATCDLLEVREAVEQARRLPAGRHVIVVQLHPVDFQPGKETLPPEEFDDLLAWVASQDDIAVRTIREACDDVDGLDASALSRNKWHMAAAYLLPPALRRRGAAEHVYLAGPIATSLSAKAWVWVVALYGTILVVLFLIGNWTARWAFAGSRLIAGIFKCAVPLGLCAAGACAVFPENHNYRGAIILCGVVGAGAGVLAAFLRLRKNRQADPPDEPTPRKA